MDRLLTMQDVVSHLLPKMDKDTKAAGKKYETYENIIEAICPSKTVKQYWREINHKFTDAQLATIIHEEMAFCDEMQILESLRKIAAPEVGAAIICYFAEVEKWLAKFQTITDDTCFVVYSRYVGYDFDYEIVGITQDFPMALELAQSVDNGQQVMIEKRKYVAKSDKADGCGQYWSGEMASITFDKFGYISSLRGFYHEDGEEPLEMAHPFGYDRFKIPHPFRKGEVVRCIDYCCEKYKAPCGALAYVDMGPSGIETYDEYEDNRVVQLGGLYDDNEIPVEILDQEGDLNCEEIMPFYLGKAEDDGCYPYRILNLAGTLCSKGTGRLQEIQMYLDEYRKLKDKNAKCSW